MNPILPEIDHFIESVKDLRVCVVGETILDTFIEVVYEGQSMKSFCPVFRYANNDGNKHVQQGGAAAIARHLEDFVQSVQLVTNQADEIVKTRLIDKDGKNKHVEINRFDNRNFGPIAIDSTDFDVVIVADFGHGFCDKLEINGAYHFMTQTNSNNFGYNRMSKWKNHAKKSVCMDLREASLQVNRKTDFSEKRAIADLYAYEIEAEKLFLTLGRRGAAYFDGKTYVHQPIFESPVVDTIGAGDTFFAFASLCSERTVKDLNSIMLVPALAASLSCTWLCNEQAVTIDKLKNHAARFIP